MSVMNPPGTLFLKDILRLKDKCNINNPHLTHMKGTRNAKGASLCLPFLISGKFDSTDPFWYHLQVSDPDRLPGMSNADYKPFRVWLETSKEHVSIITATSQNAKLDPS